MNFASKAGQGRVSPGTLYTVRHRNKFANVWFFESPKNQQRYTIIGDVPFMHTVLLEGDVDVTGYRLVDDPFSINTPPGTSRRDGYLEVSRRDGTRARYTFSLNAYNAHLRVIESEQIPAGVELCGLTLLTSKELKSKEILFDNWLLLCGAINRARHATNAAELRLLYETMRTQSTLR